jgi:hypothetical protein
MSAHVRKFLASAVTAVGVLGSAVLTGADLKTALATFLVAVTGAAAVYFVPNEV